MKLLTQHSSLSSSVVFTNDATKVWLLVAVSLPVPNKMHWVSNLNTTNVGTEPILYLIIQKERSYLYLFNSHSLTHLQSVFTAVRLDEAPTDADRTSGWPGYPNKAECKQPGLYINVPDPNITTNLPEAKDLQKLLTQKIYRSRSRVGQPVRLNSSKTNGRCIHCPILLLRTGYYWLPWNQEFNRKSSTSGC